MGKKNIQAPMALFLLAIIPLFAEALNFVSYEGGVEGSIVSFTCMRSKREGDRTPPIAPYRYGRESLNL